MEPNKKNAVEKAAISVTKSANTQVVEVIESERDLKLGDRVAAATAALLLCGATYFAIWLLLSVILDNGTAEIFRLIPWTWRLPFYATMLTAIAAFVSPGWGYSAFGKVAAVFANLIDEALGPRK